MLHLCYTYVALRLVKHSILMMDEQVSMAVGFHPSSKLRTPGTAH